MFLYFYIGQLIQISWTWLWLHEVKTI